MQGKFVKVCSIALASLWLTNCAKVSPPPPATETLPEISLQDTVGKWYEIASVPKYFSDCHCSYATYELDDNILKSSNYCRQKSAHGPENVNDVLFYPVKGSHNSRFVVKFNWLFSGNFWIVYASRADKTAVIATPDKKHFWIIARDPSISDAQYQTIVTFLQQKGYPVNLIKRTDQSCWITKTSG